MSHFSYIFMMLIWDICFGVITAECSAAAGFSDIIINISHFPLCPIYAPSCPILSLCLNLRLAEIN